jgi:3-deoxy-D-manno-octulosonate 8-phosphate phosphatase (KDO 8-P phosphatase)
MLLSPNELAERARRIRLVLTDCDGVLTDTGVFYADEGETLRRFSVRDGMGVELLRHAGIATGIISGETSAAIFHRASKLALPFCYLGVRDKAQHLGIVCRESGLTEPEIAFMGDDVNDLALMERVAGVGLTGAPRDAMPSVMERAHHRSGFPGGYGAFRDFADWILNLRNQPF